MKTSLYVGDCEECHLMLCENDRLGAETFKCPGCNHVGKAVATLTKKQREEIEMKERLGSDQEDTEKQDEKN